jgi:hypothetical protein
LFNQVISSILMVGIGLLYLWRCGIDIRQARISMTQSNDALRKTGTRAKVGAGVRPAGPLCAETCPLILKFQRQLWEKIG